MLYTRSIHLSRNYFHTSDISFALRDNGRAQLSSTTTSERFLNVRPFWEEDSGGSDYGWLDVVIEDTPAKIADKHSPNEKLSFFPMMDMGLCSTIDLAPASPISRVILLSKNFWISATNGEKWIYHFALLVEHNERFRYLISYEPSPLCWLRFTFDEKEIEIALKSAEQKEILEN